MRTIQANVTMPRLGAAGHWARALVEGLLAMEERRRQRRALLSLDDRLLKDIGLSRADVDLECGKPFWR